MSNDKTCIYCRQTDSDRFRGVEHVIPQGFGRFGSETPTLDCVCDDCNAYFGRELDQLLTRDTYEGISVPLGRRPCPGQSTFRGRYRPAPRGA
jgi:hypothetical protein